VSTTQCQIFFFPKNTLSIDNEKTQTQKKIVEKIYENMKRESCFQITDNDTTHNTLKQKKKIKSTSTFQQTPNAINNYNNLKNEK